MLKYLYIFITWLFNLMLVAGVFILRKKMPNAIRPYKVWGYSFVPIIALLCTSLYLVITLYNDITAYNSGKINLINSVFGLALTAIGIPFYFYFKKKYK